VSGKLEWYIHVSFDSALGPKSFDLLTCCVSSYSYRSRAYSCFWSTVRTRRDFEFVGEKMSEFAITKYPVNLFSRMYFAIFL
jgi:hypothetical protein